jgi:hypothetical protein
MVNIKKYFRLNPRISVFISCFFISILFWLMIVFSKEYTYKIKVKALYANVPSDKDEMNVPDPPEIVTLLVVQLVPLLVEV